MERKYCRDSPWLNHSSNYQKSSKRKTRIYRKEENIKEQSQRGRILQNRLKPEAYKKIINFHWLETKQEQTHQNKQTNKKNRIFHSLSFVPAEKNLSLQVFLPPPLLVPWKGLRTPRGREAASPSQMGLKCYDRWSWAELKQIWKRCKIKWAKKGGNWSDLFSSPRPTQLRQFQPRYSHQFNSGKRDFLFLTLKAHLHTWPSPSCPWAPAPLAAVCGLVLVPHGFESN